MTSPPTKKGAATRQRVLDAALALFRDKGFDATTMRDIARAAGLSTGAAYHYFASKEALVQAYYHGVLDDDEARLAEVMRADPPLDLRERLGRLLHGKIAAVAGDRDMVAALFRRIADPRDPVSIFAAGTADDRHRAIAIFTAAIDADTFPEDAATLVPLALFALQLGFLLYLLQDDSEGQTKTHRLIDGALDAAVPLIALGKVPGVLTPLLGQMRKLLEQADLVGGA